MSPEPALTRSSVRGLGWPPASQRLLLAVLTSAAGPARAAWAEWRAQASLEVLDAASARVLPLILRRLRELGIEDLEGSKLEGLVRHTWVSNQLQVRAGLTAAAALTSADIPVCALKGLSLLGACYGDDLSSRPMYDVDLLVPTYAAGDALVILQSLGWSSGVPITHRKVMATRLHRQHAYELHRGRASVDLHWHVLHQDLSSFFDRVAWAHAEPLGGRGLPPGLLALAPTEQLMHVCLHGVRQDSGANRLWALDALRIVESGRTRVDWDRLVRTALQRRLGVALEDALRFVASLSPRVPSEALERLGAEPVFQVELLEYRAITRGSVANDVRGRDALLVMQRLRRSYETITPNLFETLLSGPPALRALAVEVDAPEGHA